MKEKYNRLLRITGYISLIGWVSMIMFVWILANIRGYTYFQGGEPLWWIKYPEWTLGLLGVWTGIISLKSELDAYTP